MNGKHLKGMLLAAAFGVFAAACNDNPTPFEQAPPPDDGPGNLITLFDHVATGECMGNDVLSYNATVSPSDKVSGWTTPIPSGNFCTANDIYLANATVTHVYDEDVGDFVPVTGAITCVEGESFDAKVVANLAANSAAERTDVGVWIAQGGPTQTQAVDGACNHYYLTPGVDGAVSLDDPADQCGDVSSTEGVLASLDLDVITIQCAPNQHNQVEVPACVGWTVPGQDRYCPHPEGDSDPINFRMGTVPGNTSKCNCEPFVLDIVVVKRAYLEVVKETDPADDDGRFNLFIDDILLATDVGHGGTTGMQELGAGTSVEPGETHSFSEAAFTGTSLADYETTWECRNRGGASGSRGSGTGPGPEDITLMPEDDVVCTFTNARKPEVRLVKEFEPEDDGGLVEFDIDGEADTNEAAGYGHEGETGYYQFDIGDDIDFSETGFGGTDLDDYESSWECSNGEFGTGTSGSTGALAAGDEVTCTFTNARKPEVKLVKEFEPEDDGGLVEFEIDEQADDNGGEGYGHEGATEYYQFDIGDDVDFSETGFGGTDLDDYESSWECSNGEFGTGTSGSTGALAAGDQITCTFTNKKKARLIVQKSVVGGGTQTFDFTREPGSVSFTLGDGEEEDSGFTLGPDTYTVCELDLAVSWSATATVDGVGATLINPDLPEDHGNRCVEVELDYGDEKTVVFTNTPPPGGDARTIGYWRNWSSCTGGMQYVKATEQGILDKTLDGNLPQTVGLLEVEICEDGVNILSKRDLNGANKANDGAYDLAAQLLAAKLNVSAGAGVCAAATDAIDDGQAFLEDQGFTGLGDYLRPGGSPANRALRQQALDLAGILDSYNNNTLCGA
jgi:hypothetical protein